MTEGSTARSLPGRRSPLRTRDIPPGARHAPAAARPPSATDTRDPRDPRWPHPKIQTCAHANVPPASEREAVRARARGRARRIKPARVSRPSATHGNHQRRRGALPAGAAHSRLAITPREPGTSRRRPAPSSPSGEPPRARTAPRSPPPTSNTSVSPSRSSTRCTDAAHPGDFAAGKGEAGAVRARAAERGASNQLASPDHQRPTEIPWGGAKRSLPGRLMLQTRDNPATAQHVPPPPGPAAPGPDVAEQRAAASANRFSPSPSRIGNEDPRPTWATETS
jgi:hypothetical protein